MLQSVPATEKQHHSHLKTSRSFCKQHQTSTSQKPCLPTRYNDSLLHKLAFNLPVQSRTIIPNHLFALKETKVPSLGFVCRTLVSSALDNSELVPTIEEGRQVRNERLVQSAIAIRQKYPKHCACRRDIKTVSPGYLSSACCTIGRTHPRN